MYRSWVCASLNGIAPSVSRCPPAQKSYESHRCSWAALWRQAPVVGSVLVWNTPALPALWPVRPHWPERLRSCANPPTVRRARWVELERSAFLELQRCPPPLLLFGWRAGWGNYGLSSWPAGWRRRVGPSLTRSLAPPHWNELLNLASLTKTSL